MGEILVAIFVAVMIVAVIISIAIVMRDGNQKRTAERERLATETAKEIAAKHEFVEDILATMVFYQMETNELLRSIKRVILPITTTAIIGLAGMLIWVISVAS